VEGGRGSLEEVCPLATNTFLDVKNPASKAIPRFVEAININGDISKAVIVIRPVLIIEAALELEAS
jgi:hypothetical protein